MPAEQPYRPAPVAPSSRFAQNRACEFFPCHAGVAPERFNCLFCYCPLYALGAECGGDFRYSASGAKDCTECTVLHDGDAGVDAVRRRFPELARLARAGKAGGAFPGDGDGAS